MIKKKKKKEEEEEEEEEVEEEEEELEMERRGICRGFSRGSITVHFFKQPFSCF